MAELIEIKKVLIGPDNMTAFVRVAEDAPLLTSEDLEGTARVYHLLPHIIEHACYGDAGETFRDAMGDTEITHLLEHVTVELLAQTDLAGDMPTGRTWVDEVDERTFEIDLSCPDDVLVAAALSCGVWILDWAYSGGEDPQPNVEAIVAGLVNLVEGVGDQGEDLVIDYGPMEDEDVISAGDLAGEGDEAETDIDAELESYTQDLARTAEERPLWTPAPEVAMIMQRTEEMRETEPEVEAEIDEIMATIESPALVLDENGAPKEAEEPADEADAKTDNEAAAETTAEAEAAEAEAATGDEPVAEAAEPAATEAVAAADVATDAVAAAIAEKTDEPEAAAEAAAEGEPEEPTADEAVTAEAGEDAPKEPAGEFPEKLASAVAAEASRARAIAAAEEALAAVAHDTAGTASDIRVIAPAVVMMRTNPDYVPATAPEEAPAEESAGASADPATAPSLADSASATTPVEATNTPAEIAATDGDPTEAQAGPAASAPATAPGEVAETNADVAVAAGESADAPVDPAAAPDLTASAPAAAPAETVAATADTPAEPAADEPLLTEAAPVDAAPQADIFAPAPVVPTAKPEVEAPPSTQEPIEPAADEVAETRQEPDA